MDQLEEPEDVPVKVDVVNDLDVIRLGAALEQQLHEVVAMRMRRTIFLAFADRAHQRRVA